MTYQYILEIKPNIIIYQEYVMFRINEQIKNLPKDSHIIFNLIGVWINKLLFKEITVF